MFKSDLDLSKTFTPLSLAVLAVSDTRTLETDTAGALLKQPMEDDGHRCAERAEEQPRQMFAAADGADLVADRAQHVVASENEEEARCRPNDERTLIAADREYATEQACRNIGRR